MKAKGLDSSDKVINDVIDDLITQYQLAKMEGNDIKQVKAASINDISNSFQGSQIVTNPRHPSYQSTHIVPHKKQQSDPRKSNLQKTSSASTSVSSQKKFDSSVTHQTNRYPSNAVDSSRQSQNGNFHRNSSSHDRRSSEVPSISDRHHTSSIRDVDGMARFLNDNVKKKK